MDFTFFSRIVIFLLGTFDEFSELIDNLKRLILVLKKINKNVVLITG